MCETDGFYYRDPESITICSNGNQYLQHCAYGTRNREANHYGHGGHYAYSDFCTVNLNDYGAGAARKGYHQPSYYQEEPPYHYFRQPTRHQSYGYGHGGGYGGGYGHGHGGRQYATQYMSAHFPAYHKEHHYGYH